MQHIRTAKVRSLRKLINSQLPRLKCKRVVNDHVSLDAHASASVLEHHAAVTRAHFQTPSWECPFSVAVPGG